MLCIVFMKVSDNQINFWTAQILLTDCPVHNLINFLNSNAVWYAGNKHFVQAQARWSVCSWPWILSKLKGSFGPCYFKLRIPNFAFSGPDCVPKTLLSAVVAGGGVGSFFFSKFLMGGTQNIRSKTGGKKPLGGIVTWGGGAPSRRQKLQKSGIFFFFF